jgi:RNA polymerase sigma factor (sigma-70 family)
MTARELERIAREKRRVLLAVAGRRARSHDDAEDAVQEALTTALATRERIRSETAVAYVAVTARHAAQHLHRQAQRTDSLDEPAAGGASRHELIADPHQADLDERLDTIAALRTLKPDQARALAARALGFSYREIADALGWSYTKTNRCVTEGRAALRALLAADATTAGARSVDRRGAPVPVNADHRRRADRPRASTPSARDRAAT